MPIYVVQSSPVMLAGNPGAAGPVGNPLDQTREIAVGQTPNVPTVGIGFFTGICIATSATPGSGDVTLVRTSVSDGGGNPQLRYVVRNNKQTASEFTRMSLVVYGFPPPP
jgi:hypothetical protein